MSPVAKSLWVDSWMVCEEDSLLWSAWCTAKLEENPFYWSSLENWLLLTVWSDVLVFGALCNCLVSELVSVPEDSVVDGSPSVIVVKSWLGKGRYLSSNPDEMRSDIGVLGTSGKEVLMLASNREYVVSISAIGSCVGAGLTWIPPLPCSWAVISAPPLCAEDVKICWCSCSNV